MPPIDRALNDDAPGTKLEHPGLTSDEILQAVGLAAAAYTETTEALTTYQTQFTRLTGADISGWEPITGDLRDLDDTDLLSDENVRNDHFYQQDVAYGGLRLFLTSTGEWSEPILDTLGPGVAEAIVFQHATTGDIALSFRGTDEGFPLFTGDRRDW